MRTHSAGSGGGPLRILVVNWLDRENPQAGGAETHLHEIFGRLATRGHQVTLLASGWAGCNPAAVLDGISVHRTGRRYTFSLAAPRYYRSRLAATPWDIVVEDLNKVPLFTPWWTHAPVALVVHHLFGSTAFREASLPLAAGTWLLERPIPWVFRHTPTVAVSESTRTDLSKRGMPVKHVSIVPNGIDLGAFRPGVATERFELPTLLYVGRVKRYKRVDLVLRAVDVLARRGIEARFLVAGKGDHLPALRRLATQLGVEKRVEFLGFVPETEKADLLRRSWVHVLTSPKEGWGIANVEAAACGTPTVASDAPGLRDSVVHDLTGLLVPHANVEALADALERVLRDPILREKLGAGARSFAEGYSWDASAEAMERFLIRVVDDSRLG